MKKEIFQDFPAFLGKDPFMPMRDMIYQYLRELIITRQLEPGSRLVEEDLGEKLHASRMKSCSRYDYGTKTICSEIPENHKWLDSFKNAKTIYEITDLIAELDNLDILFLNLNLLDTHPVMKSNFGLDFTQMVVNQYMIFILSNYKSMNDNFKALIASTGADINSYDFLRKLPAEKRLEILESFKKLPLSLALQFVKDFFISDRDFVFEVQSRIFKYNTDEILNILFGGMGFGFKEKKYWSDFFKIEIEKHPELLNNSSLVNQLCEYEIAALWNEEKILEIFSRLDKKELFIFTENWLKSADKNVQNIAKNSIGKIKYSEKLSLEDVFKILIRYGVYPSNLL